MIERKIVINNFICNIVNLIYFISFEILWLMFVNFFLSFNNVIFLLY